MVLIHVTRGTEELVFETKTSESVDSATQSIAGLHNRRLQVRRLVGGVRELAKYGPQKEEKDRGLNEEQLNALGKESKEVEGADPLGIRVGEGRPSHSQHLRPPPPFTALPPSEADVFHPMLRTLCSAPPPQLQATLNKVCDDAEAAISNNHAKLRRPLSLPLINACVDNIRGAVLMAYPMNLPPYDVVRLNIEGAEDLSQHEDSTLQVDPSTAVLWFAGKAMDRARPLSDYIGTNEKVTIKAKIEPKGATAPSRPPPVDAETQQRLMSHWHRKEAEAKALAEETEDSYLNSEWANPRGFKQSMHGLSQVAFRPSRG